MISIRKYLDGVQPEVVQEPVPARKRRGGSDLLSLSIEAYLSALAEMGRSSVEVCPAEGAQLQKSLEQTGDRLAAHPSEESIATADAHVQTHLQEWGRRAARHFQKKAAEVKDILIVMARTAESVGERDQRCAQQISDVTAKLKNIANLDDLSQIRTSIEKSAGELKSSIDRMTAEGKAAMESLQAQVSTYRAKLEEAELIASCDALTRLRSRLWVEDQIEKRLQGDAPFCAAILDIDDFKSVNDDYGHMVGDELLKQFAKELGSNCRSSDIVGRWGGDEFILLLDCKLQEAESQIERIRRWVCGSYTLEGSSGPIRLNVHASIGLAECVFPETMKQLLDRADVAMYRNKAETRAVAGGVRG
jgi:diguanylate cyclase (GGDEF)-like protein